MITHTSVTGKDLGHLVRLASITLAGNRLLKIYGTLQCRSGRRMKKENRVFFIDEREAVDHGFRPCGHCLKQEYARWKHSKDRVERT